MVFEVEVVADVGFYFVPDVTSVVVDPYVEL